MYQSNDQQFGNDGGTVALSIQQALNRDEAGVAFGRKKIRFPGIAALWRGVEARVHGVELVPDLGARIGSREWFRGAAICLALCAVTWALSPGYRPIAGAVPHAMDQAAWQDARAYTIAPLAYGSDTGRRMAANAAVTPLTDIPERPSLELVATLGQGDGFARVLTRAGVGASEASNVANLVSGAVGIDDIAPGTRMDIVLGRRADRTISRPLDFLALRAKFDLRVQIERIGGALSLKRIPIAVDNTPLRIQGRVGPSLYRSARAAGAPGKAVEAYIKALATKISIGGDVRPDDHFDIIVAHARAETGETQIGQLLYAGLNQGKRNIRMLQWTSDGRTEWYEASGVGQKRGALTAPVAGRQTSGFGMRRHPLLGYSRFHKGLDFGAPYGAPIYAVTDGSVSFAGRGGGYGNLVKLNHGNGIATAYGHMSRIAVRAGASVRRGQVIGYVGSTGMSTGPHLHYELYKNGVAINPRSLSFTTTSQLAGSDLIGFRAKLARMLSVRPGAGATPMSGSGGKAASR